MGRRWVGIEVSSDNVERYALPRLRKVVAGEDRGGITKSEKWKGGGGFTVLDVAPSMFTEDDGAIVLADWAVGGALGEAVAANLGYTPQRAGPFCGRKGRSRLAVIDGLVNTAVAELLIEQLDADETVLLVGTGLDPEVADYLSERRAGSMAQLIPQAILNSYGRPRRWTPTMPAEGTT
jgi:adenine-specific DNA-methyltransferase